MRNLMIQFDLLLNPFYVKMGAIGALVLSPVLLFFKPLESFLLCMVAIGLIDVITGIMKNRKDFCSDRLWKRKAFIVFLFALGLITMMALDIMLGQQPEHYVAKSWCLFYASYEATSITENLEKLGLPQAGFIMRKIKGKMDHTMPQDKKDD